MKQRISFLSQMCLLRDPQQFGASGVGVGAGALNKVWSLFLPWLTPPPLLVLAPVWGSAWGLGWVNEMVPASNSSSRVSGESGWCVNNAHIRQMVLRAITEGQSAVGVHTGSGEGGLEEVSPEVGLGGLDGWVGRRNSMSKGPEAEMWQV